MTSALILPRNLPATSSARLPQTYEAAKGALEKCSHIDECADWANKAEALASYARQAKDDGLRKMADRIQARAIRRCGSLLKEIEPGQGARTDIGGEAPRSRAAREAGLSRDQKRTALRVANVPEQEFESAVESEHPPTVTELAERGKIARPLMNTEGRDAADITAATQAQGHLERLARMAESISPAAVVRGTFTKELPEVRDHAKAVCRWCAALITAIKKSKKESVR